MKTIAMDNFDKIAQQTVCNLQDAFNRIPSFRFDNVCKYSIGIEIEIKFRHAFPDVFKSHVLTNNLEAINDIIKDKEALYFKTIECGIPLGADKYWEFSFTPVHNTSLLVDQIEILSYANLIPSGDHSLHITIGGIDKSEKSYWILRIMELLYIKKERVISMNWNKKGLGGILERIYQGYEMRTLTMSRDTDMDELFRILIILLDSNHWKIIKQKCLSLGLPDEIWMPKTIDIYYTHFDELKEFVKEIKIV